MLHSIILSLGEATRLWIGFAVNPSSSNLNPWSSKGLIKFQAKMAVLSKVTHQHLVDIHPALPQGKVEKICTSIEKSKLGIHFKKKYSK